MPDFDDDAEEICKLFGSSKPVRTARFQFSDAFICNETDLSAIGLTEIKFENTINRKDCIANPRQIERVVPGAKFAVRIVYDVQGSQDETEQDMKLLAKGMKLLQMDYLGGHGTRGSGRVSFQNFKLTDFEAGLDTTALEKIFKDVDTYELLPV